MHTNGTKYSVCAQFFHVTQIFTLVVFFIFCSMSLHVPKNLLGCGNVIVPRERSKKSFIEKTFKDQELPGWLWSAVYLLFARTPLPLWFGAQRFQTWVLFSALLAGWPLGKSLHLLVPQFPEKMRNVILASFGKHFIISIILEVDDRFFSSLL